MQRRTQQRPSRIGALAFVAVVIALAGYFVAWQPWHERQQPVSEEEQRTLDEQLVMNSENLQTMIEERLSVEQLAVERERQESQLGQELSLRCLQWTDLNDSQPSENTETFQEWACKRFNHYVATGELLTDEPEAPDWNERSE